MQTVWKGNLPQYLSKLYCCSWWKSSSAVCLQINVHSPFWCRKFCIFCNTLLPGFVFCALMMILLRVSLHWAIVIWLYLPLLLFHTCFYQSKNFFSISLAYCGRGVLVVLMFLRRVFCESFRGAVSLRMQIKQYVFKKHFVSKHVS